MSNDKNDSPKEQDSYEKVTHLLAEFDTPGALIEAAKKVRDAGYEKWDCHSPFPVHGIDPAMGIKPTILPLLVFGGGFSGLVIAVAMQFYFNAQEVTAAGIFSGWEWTVSGKPDWSIPANIPIAFELTILLAAFATFLGMWGLNKLPQVWHPLFSSNNFLKASDDSFFVSIDADDSKFNQTKTAAFLSELGGTNVETIKVVTGKAHRKLPKGIIGFIIISTALTLVPLAFIAKARASTSDKPHIHVIPNMDFQPHTGAQDGFAIFADGRSAQPYVAGTIARGVHDLREDSHMYQGIVAGDDGQPEWAESFPKQVSLDMTTMKRGQNRFKIYCAPCHGQSGNGEGVVHARAEAVGAIADSGWNQPTNILTAPYAKIPHGQIFNTISYGIRTMPGYRTQLPVEDRWAIAFYVRALQRAECDSKDNLDAEQRQRVKGQQPLAPAPKPSPGEVK